MEVLPEGEEEMTEQIRDANLRDLNARAERAQAAYEEGEKALFRADGSKYYSDEVHDEEIKKLAAERRGVLDGIERQAGEVRLSVESEIESIENADPADSLTPDELERANQKRAFAIDASETLSAEAFDKRCESVLAGGDRGSIFAYWMAGQRKSRERSDRVPIGGVLARMEAALGGESRAARVEEASRRGGEAMRAGLLASNLKVGARSTYEAYRKRRLAGHGDRAT